MDADNFILKLNELELGYQGTDADILLKNINLGVSSGEFIALIGRNGSGKTSLLRTLINLIKPRNGRIFLKGVDLENYRGSDIARQIGYVPATSLDNSGIRVRDLVRTGRYPHTNLFGLLNTEDIEKIDQAMKVTGVEKLAERKLWNLSDGEKQRVMLARVFAQDTDIILLDEPTSFLDIPNKYRIFSLINDLKSKNKTIIITTHDLNLVSKFADKLWLIHGKTIIEGAPEDIFMRREIEQEFSQGKVLYDREKGEFGPSIKPVARVRLESGENISGVKVWTKKALQRNGVLVDPVLDKKLPHIANVYITKENDEIIWILRSEEQNLSVSSLYQLITSLKTLQK